MGDFVGNFSWTQTQSPFIQYVKQIWKYIDSAYMDGILFTYKSMCWERSDVST